MIAPAPAPIMPPETARSPGFVPQPPKTSAAASAEPRTKFLTIVASHMFQAE
jgi:hypothetical protein